MENQEINPPSQVPQPPPEKVADITETIAFKLGSLTERAKARRRWQVFSFFLVLMLILSLMGNAWLEARLSSARDVIRDLRDQITDLQQDSDQDEQPQPQNTTQPDQDELTPSHLT
jgi:Sec-independent protein translocase protein TatA